MLELAAGSDGIAVADDFITTSRCVEREHLYRNAWHGLCPAHASICGVFPSAAFMPCEVWGAGRGLRLRDFLRSMTAAQRSAIAFVRARAELAFERHRAPLTDLVARAGATSSHALADVIRSRAKVCIAFHPDRVVAGGSTVAEGLLREGRYRGQFETGISNGSRTAFPGGERSRWESELFGGAYEDADPYERPKYGSLDLLRHPEGPSPRFGSCHLVLRAQTHARCTVSWGDSHLEPEHVGTLDLLEPVLFALLQSVDARGEALGLHGIDLATAVRRLCGEPASPRPLGRALDDYIEVQIHAPISLAEDVEALVIDPAFDGTSTGELLERLADTHRLSLRRHPGFVLCPSDVPADFRGPRMPALAERLDLRFAALPGRLDCAVIGDAARSLHEEPAQWSDWATPEETLQHLKQLWHVLVRFGHPRFGDEPQVPSPP